MTIKTAMTALAAASTMSACMDIPESYTGDVVDFNGDLVTIESVWNGTGTPTITPAQQALADDVCGSPSRFVGATSKDDGSRTVYGPLGTSYVGGSDFWPMMLYRFACQG